MARKPTPKHPAEYTADYQHFYARLRKTMTYDFVQGTIPTEAYEKWAVHTKFGKQLQDWLEGKRWPFMEMLMLLKPKVQRVFKNLKVRLHQDSKDKTR